MFEKYTEPARRAIFFARYEASVFGSPFIEAHHLLLGALREEKRGTETKIIRQDLEKRFARGPKISTSVDLPLSKEAVRALDYAAEEAQKLNNQHVDTGHLLIGIARVEGSVAAELLRQNVIPPYLPETAASTSVVKPLGPAAVQLSGLLDEAERHLKFFSELDAVRIMGPKRRCRKDALGHLLDWATPHHQWFARALTEPTLVASGYPQDDWALPSITRASSGSIWFACGSR